MSNIINKIFGNRAVTAKRNIAANQSNANTANSSVSSSLQLSQDANANYFNNNNSNLMSISSVNDRSESQSEENPLYSSVNAPEFYRIRLLDSEASIRCGLKNYFDSYYTLIVTTISISLAEDGKILFTWPFRHIRRYGCTKDGFSLEAGRKCASGDGLFSFITKDGNAIFQAVATHVNSLKASNSLTNDSLNSIGFSNNNGIQTLKTSETLSDQSHSYFNNETRTIPISSSPPLANITRSAFSPLSSSLSPSLPPSLPHSNRLPEPSKRYSVQPPKSPEMVSKMAVTRITSISTATTTIAINAMPNSDPKSRSLKPSKPPRKSKDSKLDEPLFGTREEILGLPPELSDYETKGTYREINGDEMLYDEPGELMNHASDANDEPLSKTPFCPSPPPVNQTVSKLTSVLKMMFSGNLSNQVSPKHSKEKRTVSVRSNSIGSANSSPQAISNLGENKAISSEELAYAHVSIVDANNKADKNYLPKSKDTESAARDSIQYSKIIENTNNNQRAQTDYSEHEYANIDTNVDHSKAGNGSEYKPNPLHYVQNDCEYARVVKRTNMIANNMERTK